MQSRTHGGLACYQCRGFANVAEDEVMENVRATRLPCKICTECKFDTHPQIRYCAPCAIEAESLGAPMGWEHWSVSRPQKFSLFP